MQNMFVAALIAITAPTQGEAVMQHVIGRYDVKITPVASVSENGIALGRILVENRFSGR